MITKEEKILIDETVRMNGIGGVMVFIYVDGTMMTNYVPFKKYFVNRLWTREMSNYVFNKYGRGVINPGKIASEVIRRLREKSFDCVNKGSYHDISGHIHDAVFYTLKDFLKDEK
jgi:hypothetical protein